MSSHAGQDQSTDDGRAGDVPDTRSFDANQLRWLDGLCDEFESRWRSNDRPRIEDYLARSAPQIRGQLLMELLALELDYRYLRREPLDRQEYISRFHEHAQAVGELFDTQLSQQEKFADASTIRSKTQGPLAPLIPAHFGKYEILEELGRGGMGVVYKARQTDLERLVAVKVLLAGSHADQRDLDRFKAEAEAVARLQHPNIVQVFEVNEHDGRPFFSLELVAGGHLGQRIAGVPQPPRAAAELVATLARAIHHAHERGIIHRDLKPANILLENAPEEVGGTGLSTGSHRPLVAKISDFGLAKRLESNEHTRTGTVIGTASYMSPEQARGETAAIGPAADIYALGAILYELLTGRAPFRGETPWDTVSQVISDEPVPPTRLQPKVPRDLETVCLKCLHKEPDRRYLSAVALADDLQRFIDRRPILARPVAAWERGWKWARRRPAVAALLAALAVVVVLGLVSTTLLWRLAERRRNLADETARNAREAIREHFILVTQDPEFQKDGMQRPRAILLDKALGFFQDFAKLRQNDPALRADVADAYQRVGQILVLRGSLDEAAANLLRASRLWQELSRGEPENPEFQAELAETLSSLARVRGRQGDFKSAHEHQAEALAARSRLAKRHPEDTSRQLEYARCRLDSGFLYYDQNEFQSALDEFQPAREMLVALEKTSSRSDVRTSLADCLVGIGHVMWASKRPKEAAPVYEQAIELREKELPQRPFPYDRCELARTHGSLGQAREALGDYDKALQSFERSLKLREELVESNPNVTDYRSDLALTYKNIADELIRRGDKDKSFEMRKRVIEQLEQIVNASPGNVNYAHALAVGHLAIAQHYRRHTTQPDKAAEHVRLAIHLWEDLQRRKVDLGPHRFNLAGGYGELAMQHLTARNYAQALAEYDRSNRLLEELRTTHNPEGETVSQLGTNWINMAHCHEMLSQNADGLRLAAKALLLREALVREFPNRLDYQQKLERTRVDLPGAATIYIDRAAPLANAADKPARLKVQIDRRALWENWRGEFPQIRFFQDQIAQADLEIQAIERDLDAEKPR